AMPERSNQEQMSEQVVRGHHIWNKNNCMGCHTLMGEGAYYAPELTKVVDRRPEVYIDDLLQDPKKYTQDGRQMVKYDIFDGEKVGEEVAAGHRADIIAFLAWVSRIDTNGFPADPDMAGETTRKATPVAAAILEAAPKTMGICFGCHSVQGGGGVQGPALDGVSERFDDEYLRKWISDPQSVKPGTTMPPLGIEGADLDAVVEYLNTLEAL
ncbi:MAG: c-type cytochrome, partial [bacterium]|nr:c-type cytochrome [bacterium]